MIIHVLADGTVVPDITGKVIKVKDNPEFYKVLREIERRIHNEEKAG